MRLAYAVEDKVAAVRSRSEQKVRMVFYQHFLDTRW